MWKPVPRGSDQGSSQVRIRVSWYARRPTATTATRAANPIAARWTRLPPATKNIVSPVRPMTIVVPRSGSLKTRATIGARMMRNGIVPDQNPLTRVPRFANQWAR